MVYKFNSIFPTTFLYSSLERDITSEEFSVAQYHSDKVNKNVGNLVSLDQYVFNNHQLGNIKERVYDCINVYVNELIKPKTELEFYITQSWFNYTTSGGYHHKHNHNNSLISGVVYFSANPEQDQIIFYKYATHHTIYIEPKEYNQLNCDSWSVPVGTGDILLFPSSVLHDVKIVSGDHTRISLAFNVFAKGVFGEYSRSTELKL